jgi:hypothetical protein
MSLDPSRDQAEEEPLSPAQALLNWRETRQSDRFKEWCLDQFGVVKVGSHEFHPEQVLGLKEGLVGKLRDECRIQLETDDAEAICSHYPSPIAFPYHQFLHGPRDPKERLTRMRDTWEGLINLLFSFAVAEATQIGVGVSPVMVIESTKRRPVRARDLRSDALSVRIGLLDGLLQSWAGGGIKAAVSELIPVGVVEELRRLNSVRNEFSHRGTLSAVQARELIKESEPILRQSLVDILGLADVRFLRLRHINPGTPPIAEVESLNGHGWSRTISDFRCDSPSDSLLMYAGRVDERDRVIAKIGTRVLDLAPYFYAADDDTGHHTRVAFLKKRSGDKCLMEVVGESLTMEIDAAPHAPEFSRCERAVTGNEGGGDDE